MVILGVNCSHSATACLLKNGEIIACISEERLTRVKNQSGLPLLSINECLKIAKLNIKDVDYLVLNFKDPKASLGFSAFQGDKTRIATYNKLKFTQRLLGSIWSFKKSLLVNFPSSIYIINKILLQGYKYFIDPKAERRLMDQIEEKLNIPKTKIIKADHHTTHVLAGYYANSDSKQKRKLIFSLDSWGDGICATVNVAKNGKLERIATTPAGSSIGDLYALTTIYLGMKGGEHEYKVMGLAPYAEKNDNQNLLKKMQDLIWVNSDLTFGSKIHSSMFHQLLPKLYAYERFDNIAQTLQTFTEKLLCEWIERAIAKTNISEIICTGGVFMNVKANQKISQMSKVDSMYIAPSCEDESTALGAAFYGYIKESKKKDSYLDLKPLKHLYLGGEFSDSEIKQEIDGIKNKKFKVEKPKDIEETVASYLAADKIVARFAGRMEWGARALGNRSILANPQKLEVINKINDQIKSRDFWMPFAPSILEEDSYKYFVNKKKIAAPYMTIAFNTTLEGRDSLKAAIHQYDHSLRPQVVYKDWNPSYYKLIKKFKKLTGVGGVLNTSFNLHGFPIVYSPKDAIYVFLNSELEYLALGPYLLSKKRD